jgi:hypothetical protein
LLEGLNLGVRGSVLPVIDDVIGGNDYMSTIHRHILWLNTNILAVHWASNGIAKLDHPGIFGEIWLGQFRDKDTVVAACLDVAEGFHVFYRLFIDLGVPESDAHVSSLGLAISKDDGVVEERPHILWLDVGE